MKRTRKLETVDHPNALIVGVQTPTNTIKNIESYFEEFRNLVESNGVVYQFEFYVKLRSIDPGYFLTKGKLNELVQLCQDNKIDHVIFSEPLSNQQERNLQKILRAKVFDRTELILDIFEKHAHSAEGKIQVEIAMTRHKKARLAGKGIALSQQAGGIGTRGPGETLKEKELQHLEQHIKKLTSKLKTLEKARATQRKQRLSQEIPLVSLIGYTNAGKSTILNALTKSDVLVEDMPFATLDTTTRELFIDSKKKGLISDTVGFIQNLPHKLVDAFKSTLAELSYADLLLLVIDASDPNWQEHIDVVYDILDELEIKKPIVYVFNKIDLLPPEQQSLLHGYAREYFPSVFVSGLSKDGLAPLIELLHEWAPQKTS